MAAAMTLSSFVPTTYAQAATWQAGPGAVGSSTYIGRVEAPTARRNINPSASLLVTGWAADTTAQGWAGIDGVEVWSGAQGSGGTKLASGSVGQPRPDVAETIGGNFLKSGFSAVVPSSAWTNMQPGSFTLYVYIHTPNKGSWSRTVPVTLVQAPVLPYPNDPIVQIAKPQEGMNITQRQLNNKFTASGIALDRNPLSAVQNSLALLPPGVGQTLGAGCSGCTGNTNNIYTQHRGTGVNTITAYIDSPPKPGDTTQFGNFGTPCTTCLAGVSILVNNAGFLNRQDKPEGSIITDAFGLEQTGDPEQFRFAGWVISFNPALLEPGPHRMYVTATSAVTGKTSTTSVGFNIIPFTNPSQKIQP
jgi:hypothetical protein